MEKQKRPVWKTVFYVFLGLTLLGVLSRVINDSPESVQKPASETRVDRIKKAFSQWDGSQSNLVEWVKSSMNDPKSFDHLETVYREKGDSLFVIMQFTGKNAFGGVVKNTATCWTDLDGNIISQPAIIR